MDEIIARARKSPGMSATDAKKAVEMMRKLRQSADETMVQNGYIGSSIFPNVFSSPGVAVGCNVSFDMKGMPYVAMAPPLPAPKPDQHYCFAEDQFSAEQDYKQSSVSLRPYSKPTTAGRWPFFMVEFKSQPKGGTLWVAENQNAISGAFAVHAMTKLISMVNQNGAMIDSVTFSCCLDAKHVSLWVHYLKDSKVESAELCDLSMSNEHDVVFCRNAVLNITDWGIETRLPMILNLLSQIALPEMEAEEKRRRTRACSTDDGQP